MIRNEAMRKFAAWLLRKTNTCGHRSPEGWICTRERFHSDLHYDPKGRGYAWGGNHEN